MAIINGTAVANVLNGTALDDTINGLGGNDTLNGNAGNDLLDGGTGADKMAGGTGNDTYVVDSISDVVTEAASAGTDTVRASITYTLGTNVENLVLTGIANINGTGNTLNNVITGNSGKNVLNGGAGNDRLDGGAGIDTLIGGAGDDTFVFGAGDLISEAAGGGTDTVETALTFTLNTAALANVENLKLTGASAIGGTGNALNNVITGNGAANKLDGGAGNDRLDGGLGNDTMIGGAGNDVFVLSATGDVVTEAAGGGTDTVESAAISLDLNLTKFANVENATLTGNSNLNLTGNGGANVLTGNAGNNILDGKAGIDTMIGGLGNDTYVVDSMFETVTEAVNAGTDTVQAGIDYSLSLLPGLANVENLTLTGTAAIDGTGNALNNVITGNGNENLLSGRAGNDTLIGGAGADILLGGAGNDALVWDAADDLIDGGAGVDTLRVDGAGQIVNLSAVPYGGIRNIENIDLTGSGNNTLYLNGPEALNLSNSTDVVRITGNAGDVVNTDDHWTPEGTEVIDSVTYNVFSKFNAELQVQDGVVFNNVNNAPEGPEVGSFPLDPGTEDTPYLIDSNLLLQEFTDPDNDTLFVANLTSDHGTAVDNNDGTWTLTPDEDYSGPLTLYYDVIDGFGGSASTSLSFDLNPAADNPELTALDATGTEDSEIPLSISVSSGDSDGSETLSAIDIVISGVPEGAVLSAGTDNGDGTWSLAPEELVELSITPPADSEASFDLTVTVFATSSEGVGEVSSEQTIHVTIVPEEAELTALEGTAVDGYIVGATVFADTNENGTLDAGEAWTTTGGSGQFSLVGGTGPLVLFGGTDISTGLAFEGTLRAPEGATVVTPLTTLIAELVSSGAAPDAATAEGQLETALGLSGVDLTTFDPVAAALDGDTGNDAAALSVFAAGVQVQNAIVLASSLIAGTGDANTEAATSAVIAALAETIGNAVGAVDLTDATEMGALVTAAAVEAGADIGTTADEAGAIIAATNTVVDDAIATAADNLDALTGVAQVAIVAQDTGTGAAAALAEAGSSGDATAAQTDFTGSNLDTAVDDAADDVGTVGGAVNGTSGNDSLDGDAGNNVIDGLGGNDFLAGEEGNDILIGGAGRDNLDGHDGNDQLFGGTGDDFLTGAGGDDLLDGGENPANQLHDFDTANYELNDGIDGATGINVNLLSGIAIDGLGGTDTLVNIEKVIGTNFNDVLIGGNPANFGSNRAETFEGRGGDDTITGGSDLQNAYSANYARAASGIFLNLGATVNHGETEIVGGTAQDGDGGLDTLSNINRVRGSEHDDVIYGSDSTVGVERFQAGDGSDYIDGQGGIDYVQYQDAPSAVWVAFYTQEGVTGFGNANDDGYGNTDVFVDIEGVRASAFNDLLIGNDENQRFEGMAGNDIIDGNGGSDRVEYGQSATGVIVNLSDFTVGVGQTIIAGYTAFDGFGGVDSLSDIEEVTGSRFNDTFIGTSGDNRFDGGLGVDTVSYQASAGAVIVTLDIEAGGGGSGNDFQNTVGGGEDILRSIENLTGSPFNDELTGDANANRLNGRGGNDFLIGGGGNDILDGGENSSNVVPDADTVDYSNSASGVTVNLGTGVASDDGLGGTDTLISIERVIGSGFNDNLTGGDVHNIGTGVSEQLEGRAGDDVLTGGAIIDGFTTMAIYANDIAGIMVNLDTVAHELGNPGDTALVAAGTAFDGWGDTDTLVNINRIRGSAHDDFIIGGNPVGGTNTERFEGMAGNDYIDGGGGIDYLHYQNGNPTSGINITFSMAGSGSVIDGFGDTDIFTNIEGVRGTSHADTLTGSNRSDVTERFEGMGGNDTISGNGGNDRVEYGQSGSGVNVNLATGTASDGFGGTDTLSGIEQATGSRFGDTLIGNTGANYLNGSGGNDTLIGGAGNDTLDGGENISDLLADSDLVRYDVAGATGVNVNLATGTASDGLGGTDTLISIERVIGTSSADTLTGGDTANIGTGKSEQFEGLGGADIITGGGIVAGFTTFAMYTSAPTGVRVNIGDASVDLTAFGESGTLLAGTARDGYGTVDTLSEINRVRGSAFADRLFGGDSPPNTNERFEGMAGNDYIDGGAGIDYLHYNSGSPTTGVTVDLGISGTAGNGTVANDGFGGTDTFLGIEGVRGSNFADNLIGSNRVDVTERFEGMGGNDVINGNGGIDRLEYGQSENGINVNLALGTALDGWGSVDTLSGIEEVLGSRLNDTLTGNAGANRLDGSEGNDRIAGGAGDDLLIGGLDADTFDWNFGDQGTEDSPAVDTVTDFNMGAGDRLDLRDLLVGENGSNLDQYLDFGSDGSDTFIEVRSAGLSGVMDQVIVLEGIDLTAGSTLSDADIINNLLSAQALLADGVV